jgi:hypothetical protein
MNRNATCNHPSPAAPGLPRELTAAESDAVSGGTTTNYSKLNSMSQSLDSQSKLGNTEIQH